MRKAVIPAPHYCMFEYSPIFMISNLIKGAKLANIEIIDIIEETHADLLCYLSNKRYSEMIKLGMKIAIFDTGSANCVCKIYEISEREEKRYGTCVGELHMKIIGRGSGRDIDDMVIEEMEDLLPEKVKNSSKIRILEAARKIKHHLSFEESIK